MYTKNQCSLTVNDCVNHVIHGMNHLSKKKKAEIIANEGERKLIEKEEKKIV